MQISARGFRNVIGLSILFFCINGCLGWFDMVRNTDPLAGTYTLMQGRRLSDNRLFVVEEGEVQ